MREIVLPKGVRTCGRLRRNHNVTLLTALTPDGNVASMTITGHIKAAGRALCFLSAYSPESDPINCPLQAQDRPVRR